MTSNAAAPYQTYLTRVALGVRNVVAQETKSAMWCLRMRLTSGRQESSFTAWRSALLLLSLSLSFSLLLSLPLLFLFSCLSFSLFFSLTYSLLLSPALSPALSRLILTIDSCVSTLYSTSSGRAVHASLQATERHLTDMCTTDI